MYYTRNVLASIIIITKNQKEILLKSLPILLKQNIEEKYEIIVVDSGSTDGAVEYIKSLPVKLVEIRTKTFIYAKAFNTGAKIAKGNFLVRLSGDVIPIKTDFLAELLKPFADEKVGGTYGKYTITGRSNYGYPTFWPAERFPRRVTRYSIRPNPLKMIFNKEHSDLVTNFAGGCCAIRRKIWEKRPFNENLIAAEDAEYSWFLHTIGYAIVCNPSAEVIHEHKINGKSLKPLPKWAQILFWGYFKYYFKKMLGVDSFGNLKEELFLQPQ